VIDDSKFEVEFKVIESEISTISIGKQVQVNVSSNGISLMGKISEINPVVDENGLVTVKAVVNNPGSLFDGMNVKVRIKSEVPGQLVVPKTAVVLTAKPGGTVQIPKWNCLLDLCADPV
jgi:membrane fusion protein (multidrug efflux system)